MINTKERSLEVEIMDDFEIGGEALTKSLDQLAVINFLLGGNAVTINGLKKMLKNQPKEGQLTIVDLGCGNGKMLRLIADFGRKNGYSFKLIGFDANKNTVDYAQNSSTQYPEIEFKQSNVLDDDFDIAYCDIVLSTLFLHHFTENEIVKLLKKLVDKAKIGILVNDLHRHKMAYFLFKLFCLPISNEMIVNDGLISILKGFKLEELIQMSDQIKAKRQISWKWAFRYQWILQR
ncbi:methyltransferase domain-containing protein [Namhaeicola litoreus]|uniref:Methyltransferase domain-containing protein n=1 Tax=Namhaeicola litoreus TaxID=1052145 RepID=A0ABW3Y516_9FLAO